MKKLNPFNVLIKFINSIVALCLLTAILIKYISPSNYTFTVFLSLSTPVLILLNSAFAIYWIVQLKRPFLISTLALLLSFNTIQDFYGFQPQKIMLRNDLKIMSYNVRMFNIFKWIKSDSIKQNILGLIKKTSPDVLCLQEYYPNKKLGNMYSYSYKKTSVKKTTFGQAIFSKYRIIKSGSLDFTKSNNNAIYADIVRKKDTFRVYNVHLESLRINPKKENFGQKNAKKLRLRMETSFKKQGQQVKKLLKHQQKCPYPIIICGDFNNNAFSWAYHQLKKEKKDAFTAAGVGFGKTYDYVFPLRIDFILSDKNIKVNNFKTYQKKFSDHFPIMARLQLN